jgi:vWA-MoxR associated protein C-terminal domain/Caspase domain
MKADPATRRVAAYERQRGETHLVLACHCAVPLALTPDLAYRIWANFQRDTQGRPLGIPWVAVADLLLSRLCEEAGDELYEMDGTIRRQLLDRLEQDPRFGPQRISEVAEFLLQYVAQQVHSEDLDTRDFALAQEWNALAYTRPELAAEELALALTAVDVRDRSELLRITSVVDTLAGPLEPFGSLLVYAEALHGFARGHRTAARALLAPLVREDRQIHVAGVTITIPDDLLSPFTESAPRPAGTRPARPIRKRWAILVGVDRRGDFDWPSSRPAHEDALALQRTLNALDVTTIALHDAAAQAHLLPTRANIEGELARLAQAAEPDDLLLFFFSGHVLGSGRTLALAAQDSKPSAPATMIAARAIESALDQSLVRGAVIVLDGSGPREQADWLAAGPWQQPGQEFPGAHAALLVATGGRRGPFADHLRAGLAGDADRDGHGYVTLKDLADYVKERVQAEPQPERAELSFGWDLADSGLPLVELAGHHGTAEEEASRPSAFTRRVIDMTSRPEPGELVYFTVQLEPGGFQSGRYLTTVRSQAPGDYPVVLMTDDRPGPLEEVPRRLGPVLAALGSRVARANLSVEFVLPDELLQAPVDEWVVNGGVLGADYPVVVRSLNRSRDPVMYTSWRNKWSQLQDSARWSAALIGAPQDLVSGLRSDSLPSCLFLGFTPGQVATAESSAERDVIKLAVAMGIPAMVWPRSNHAGDIERLYSRTMSAGLKRLPRSVHELRRDSVYASGRGPGLTLLWDDPQRDTTDSVLLEAP